MDLHNQHQLFSNALSEDCNFDSGKEAIIWWPIFLVKRRRHSAQASVTLRTMLLPFTIQKRLRNSVRTCSTQAPWPSLSWASTTTNLVKGWSFGSRIGCLVLYGRWSAKHKRPSILSSPSLSFLGFSRVSGPSFSPSGKAWAWACLIQKVSASNISVGRRIRSFLHKFIGSLQLVRNRWIHSIAWTRRLRLLKCQSHAAKTSKMDGVCLAVQLEGTSRKYQLTGLQAPDKN